MILGNSAIERAIQSGHIVLSPFDQDAIERVHINLHLNLGTNESCVLKPRTFINLQTIERITLSDNICAFVEGRAKLAQKGLSIEQSSTLVEPSTDSTLTLEIFNASDEDIHLIHGQKIAKILFSQVLDSLS